MSIDAMIAGCGGNRFNLDGARDEVRLLSCDIADAQAASAVKNADVVFNLAGEVSHIHSMLYPERDAEINAASQMAFLNLVAKVRSGVRVVYASTRQLYGRPESLPVTEQHLVRPTDVNGINKAAGEYYHLVYNNVFGIRACSLRLTNVYGPRQLLKHNRQGFIGWFIRLALENRDIEIYGDGTQLRDFVYVDDAADAFLRAGANDACNGEVFNVGGLHPIRHRDLVEQLIRIAGSGRFRYVAWPPEKKAIDIGDFYADYSAIESLLGWRPTVELDEGLAHTVEFYRKHKENYWPKPGSLSSI